MLARDGGTRLARFKRRLAEQGVAATLRKAFGDHVYRSSDSVLVEYRRGWRSPASPTLPEDARIVRLRRGDTLPPLCDWMAWRTDDFTAMLANGKIGLFILLDGVAVGCAWCSLEDYRDRETREHYVVGPREAYHYCWMVDPAARRGHIGIALLREAMMFLDELGVDRQFGVVDLTNRASYLIQYRFGYRECGRKVTHYYIFGTRWTRMTRYSGTLGPAPTR